eukprot:493081_1
MRSCSSKIVMRLEKAQFLSILFLLRTITGLGTNHSFTSCTSISNHSTCYINSILYKNDSSIICNPMYSNCTIQCNLNGCNKPIHCPSNICSNCIVNVINISQPIRRMIFIFILQDVYSLHDFNKQTQQDILKDI